MAIALTSDPIVTLADLQTVIPGLKNHDRAHALINSASAAFLRFTNRQRITSGELTEVVSLPPSPVNYTYLHAAPVSEVSEIVVLYNGEEDETLTTADWELENSDTGKLITPNHTVSGRGHGYKLKITYTAGWTTVPGDVQAGAFEVISLTRQRWDGQAGVRYSGMSGANAGLETEALPQSTREAWQRYRIY